MLQKTLHQVVTDGKVRGFNFDITIRLAQQLGVSIRRGNNTFSFSLLKNYIVPFYRSMVGRTRGQTDFFRAPVNWRVEDSQNYVQARSAKLRQAKRPHKPS